MSLNLEKIRKGKPRVFIKKFKVQFLRRLKCKNCTLEEQAIINILKVNPIITQEEIANKINKSIRTIKTYMAEMQKKGLIERINGKKNGEWKVNV